MTNKGKSIPADLLTGFRRNDNYEILNVDIDRASERIKLGIDLLKTVANKWPYVNDICFWCGSATGMPHDAACLWLEAQKIV